MDLLGFYILDMLEKILGNSAYWIVNKEVAKIVGINGALILADLIDKKQYFQNNGGIDSEGYFFNTSEQIEFNTTLSYHLQKQALKELKNVGFIETKLKGVPAKLHFNIVENKILKFLNTGIEIFLKQDLENFKTNKNKLNKNKVISNIDNGGKINFPRSEKKEDIKKPKKEKKEYPPDLVDCYKNCLESFEEHLKPQNNPSKIKWIETVEKLNRIDKIPFEKITEIVKWAREDKFWSTNFLSLLKLRKTNRDGVKYIIVFNEGMNKNKPVEKSKEDKAKFQQDAMDYLNL